MQNQNSYNLYQPQPASKLYSPNYSNNSTMHPEIDKIIDQKLFQNNQKIYQETNQELTNLIISQNLYNARLFDLEAKALALQSKNPTKTSNILIEDHEIVENAKEYIRIYKEEVDIDTYLYLSLAFSFTAFPLFLGYYRVIFCKKGIPFKKRMNFLICVLFSPLLLVPGITTPLLQLFCIYYVYIEAIEQYSLIDKLTYQSLKILILAIFVFMVAKEVCQSINNFFYCYSQAKSKTQFILSGCVISPILQSMMAFVILYVGFILIASTDDPIDLIQNFASVYVLLEVDNILMDFLKLSKISLFIVKINEKLNRLRMELGVESIFSKQIIQNILVEKNIEIDYEKPENQPYRMPFLISRGSVMGLLVVYSILAWFYIQNERTG